MSLGSEEGGARKAQKGKSMNIIPLIATSRRVITEVAQVDPGEEVLIITDTEVSPSIPTSLAAAVQWVGGNPSIIRMLPSPYPGAPLPLPVERAVQGAQVVFLATSKPIAHAEIFSHEKKNRRLISMPGIMEASFTEGGGTVDLGRLKEITERVAQFLQGKRHFALQSDKGTDLRFISRGRSFACFAQPPKPTGFAMFPDGEAVIAMEEKTLEGQVVMDVYQTGVGPLREPIVFEMVGGKAVKIRGGLEAQRLRELLERYGDENSYSFGEFALGTNPKALQIGSAGEDKKRIGTIHMSLGDDEGIGGGLRSRLHLDGVMGRPTLIVDGVLAIQDGQLLI